MGDASSFVDIFFFALVAVFILLRLRSVLGTRSDDEDRPSGFSRDADRDNNGAEKKNEGRDDNVVTMPGIERAEEVTLQEPIVPPNSPLASTLADISAADPSFDGHEFMNGAVAAYKMIVTAYADGDKPTLEPLLGDEVADGFFSAIDARADAGHRSEITVRDIISVEIVDVALEDNVAKITVEFVTNTSRATWDSDEQLIEGHPTVGEEITDIWTFARNVNSPNPNWPLIETRQPG